MLKQFFGGKLGDRLWFRDDYFDLTVSVDSEGQVESFEMQCDWQSPRPKHICWKCGVSLQCLTVRLGDDVGFGVKRSTVLVESADSSDYAQDIARRFKNRSANIPAPLAGKLTEMLEMAA